MAGYKHRKDLHFISSLNMSASTFLFYFQLLYYKSSNKNGTQVKTSPGLVLQIQKLNDKIPHDQTAANSSL